MFTYSFFKNLCKDLCQFTIKTPVKIENINSYAANLGRIVVSTFHTFFGPRGGGGGRVAMDCHGWASETGLYNSGPGLLKIFAIWLNF